MMENIKKIGIIEPSKEFKNIFEYIPENVEVIVVKKEVQRSKRKKGVLFYKGDGSSIDTFKKSGLKDVEILFVLSSDDEFNESAVEAGMYFGIKKIFAFVKSKEVEEKLKDKGITIINPKLLFAKTFWNLIKKEERIPPHMKKIVVSPTSLGVGEKLKHLKSPDWHIAAIYRDKKLVVPHPEVELKAGDVIYLVAEKEFLDSIAEFFTGGTPQFPLQFGASVLVVLYDGVSDRILEEIFYLLCEINIHRVDFVFCKKNKTMEKKIKTQLSKHPLVYVFHKVENIKFEILIEVIQREDYGLLIVPTKKGIFKFPFWFWKVVKNISFPVFIPKGTFPYHNILLPVAKLTRIRREMEIAVDMARIFKARITALSVREPKIVTGEELDMEEERALHEVMNFVKMYQIPVSEEIVKGNPVRTMISKASSFNLAVLSHNKKTPFNIFVPDVSKIIIPKLSISTIFIPVE